MTLSPEWIPTILPGFSVPRDSLIGGLKFVEGAATGRLGRATLYFWIEEFAAPIGATGPVAVREAMNGAVPLYPRPQGVSALVLDARVDGVIREANTQVIAALSALAGPEKSDDFVRDAVARGRVKQISFGKQPLWAALPCLEDRLSEVVLTLFAADVLSFRDQYRDDFRICDVCQRPSFDARNKRRPLCTGRDGFEGFDLNEDEEETSGIRYVDMTILAAMRAAGLVSAG
jgi:hypothetical protein